MKALLILIFVVFVVAVGGFCTVAYEFLVTPGSTEATSVVFEIPPGENLKNISLDLERQNLVTSAQKFQWFARAIGAGPKIRVGEYALNGSMRPREILVALMTGKSIEHIVTIKEGATKWEVADAFEKQGLGSKEEFLELCDNRPFIKELLHEDLPSLEGYLFPETYHVTKYTGARGLIKIMVQRFVDTYNQIATNPDIHLTRHQVVTLASIVEKETGAPKERGLVASVFYNRLAQNMKLQTDPTIIYGMLDAHKLYDGNIRHEDLITPTRYNTYTLNGLPFGPIANPGRDSLQAALHPEKTEFLYFVSRNDGTQVYSKDYGEHNKAVAKFQLDPKAREGKSWRDLGKKPNAAATDPDVKKKPAMGLSAKPKPGNGRDAGAKRVPKPEPTLPPKVKATAPASGL